MSDDERRDIADRVTSLETVVSERAEAAKTAAEKNSKILIGVIVAIVIQVIAGLFSAGSKYQMLDDLKESVKELDVEFHAHVAGDAAYREQVWNIIHGK